MAGPEDYVTKISTNVRCTNVGTELLARTPMAHITAFVPEVTKAEIAWRIPTIVLRVSIWNPFKLLYPFHRFIWLIMLCSSLPKRWNLLGWYWKFHVPVCGWIRWQALRSRYWRMQIESLFERCHLQSVRELVHLHLSFGLLRNQLRYQWSRLYHKFLYEWRYMYRWD